MDLRAQLIAGSPAYLVEGGVVDGMGSDVWEADEEPGCAVSVGVDLHGAHGVQKVTFIICKHAAFCQCIQYMLLYAVNHRANKSYSLSSLRL